VIGLRRALVALAVLGAVLIGIGTAITLSSDHNEHPVVTALLGGSIMASFIGTGLYAWYRRPGNRVGPLMTAVGFAAFLASLVSSNEPAVFMTGIVLGSLYILITAHMLLAFPTGRLETRGHRRIVAGTYVTGITAPLLIALFDEQCDCGDVAHPENVLFVSDQPAVVRIAESLAGAVGLVVTIMLAVILIRRWRAAGERERRAYAPVLLTGALLVGMLAITLALDIPGSVADGFEAAVDFTTTAAFAALPFAFLTGLARSRAWRAGAIGEVLAALGDAPGRGSLRDALREALGDPTLRLAYWLPERSAYVDATGRAIELPPGTVMTPVEREGRRVGALVHDPALAEDPELVRAVASAAALALENERLDAELRARVEELRDSRQRLLEAGLQERRRLERDLHDGAQQRLVSLSLQLGLLAGRLDGDPAGARELLDGARAEARAALEDLRELARGIHPAVLTDRGLAAALDALADRAPLPVEVEEVPDERLPGAVEAAAYFVVAESLTNVAKYAQASHAEVRVGRDDGVALIEVRDDGVGGADPEAGTGLRGLADRLAALDGRLEVESEPGRGTVVRARVPCAS
jgi:signal transduction histidine kinase